MYWGVWGIVGEVCICVSYVSYIGVHWVGVGVLGRVVRGRGRGGDSGWGGEREKVWVVRMGGGERGSC